MRIFSAGTDRDEISLLKQLPNRIAYGIGSPAAADIQDSQVKIGCLGCSKPSCLYLDEADIRCDKVNDFPSDKNTSACPVDAISWDRVGNHPIINNEKCILCGVCMRRCPAGAIYYDGCVKVDTAPSVFQEKTRVTSETARQQKRQLHQFNGIERSGILMKESDGLLSEIYDKLFAVKSNEHNRIARNLLISLGCNSAIRRAGDVYTRMDAVYSGADGTFGAVEVEFGRDTLDASRAVLDDIAVLQTRYGIPKEKNLPFVICMQLPNARQGYWQVVKGVNIVEKIRIETVTIGSLMILNWNRARLLPEEGAYYLDYDNMNLRKVIQGKLRRKIALSCRYLGILEPIK